MDELALLARIASLNARLDSLNPWLYVASIAVVVGVVFEFAIIFHEYGEDRHDWRRGIIRPPDKPSRKWLIIDVIGVALVCLGLAGEFMVEVKAGEIAEQLRTDNGQLIAILDGKASALALSTQALKTDADTQRGIAAGALQKAGEANATAEAEKLERIKLEKQVAPRTLDFSKREKLGADLQKFAKSLSGRKVIVSSYSADAEGIAFSIEIADAIHRGGIEVDNAIGRLIPVGMVEMGVKITGPIADKDFLAALAKGINDKHANAVRAEWDDKYPDIRVWVDSKPVSGFPDVTSGVPQPPKQ